MCPYLYTCAHIYTHVPISSSKCVTLYSFSLSLSLHCINAHIHAPALLIVCEHVDILSDSPWTLHTFTHVSRCTHLQMSLYLPLHTFTHVSMSLPMAYASTFTHVLQCATVCCSVLRCVAVRTTDVGTCPPDSLQARERPTVCRRRAGARCALWCALA